MIPEYSASLISFFDILGFQDIVKTKSAKEVFEILSIFKRTTKQDEDEMITYEKEYIYFSDTVVRSVNILSETNKKQRIGILFNELLDLLHIINDLILIGVLIRGSVTLGLLFKRDDIFYGPGIIDAYKLEKEAIYPRIIVDNDIVKIFQSINKKGDIKTKASDFSKRLLFLLSSDFNILLNEKNFILGILKKAKDGKWFIDYLNALISEYEYFDEYLLFLKKHKLLIEKGIKSRISDSHVLDKYLWLKRYHNNHTLNLIKKNIKIDRLIIDEIPI